MLKSAEYSHPIANLPYGLLISCMLSESQVVLSGLRDTEVSATYDSKTFASMGYTLVHNKWYKKDSVKVKVDAPKLTKISADLAVVLMKKVGKIKASLFSLTTSVQDIQETLAIILKLSR